MKGVRTKNPFGDADWVDPYASDEEEGGDGEGERLETEGQQNKKKAKKAMRALKKAMALLSTQHGAKQDKQTPLGEQRPDKRQ